MLFIFLIVILFVIDSILIEPIDPASGAIAAVTTVGGFILSHPLISTGVLLSKKAYDTATGLSQIDQEVLNTGLDYMPWHQFGAKGLYTLWKEGRQPGKTRLIESVTGLKLAEEQQGIFKKLLNFFKNKEENIKPIKLTDEEIKKIDSKGTIILDANPITGEEEIIIENKSGEIFAHDFLHGKKLYDGTTFDKNKANIALGKAQGLKITDKHGNIDPEKLKLIKDDFKINSDWQIGKMNLAAALLWFGSLYYTYYNIQQDKLKEEEKEIEEKEREIEIEIEEEIEEKEQTYNYKIIILIISSISMLYLIYKHTKINI